MFDVECVLVFDLLRNHLETVSLGQHKPAIKMVSFLGLNFASPGKTKQLSLLG